MNEDFDYISSFSDLTVTPPVPKPRKSLQSSSPHHSASPKHESRIFEVYDSASSSSDPRQQSHRRGAPQGGGGASPRGRGGRPQIRTPNRNPTSHQGTARPRFNNFSGDINSFPTRPPSVHSASSDHTSRSRTYDRGNFRGGPRGRPHRGRSGSNQRPRSVHEASFSNTGESPNHRPHHQRSSSRQRYHNERNRENRNEPQHGIGYKEVESMVVDEELECKNIALRLSTERSGFALRLKSSELHHGWIQMILKLFAKLSRGDEPNQYFNRLLMMLLHNDFQFRILEFLTDIFKANYVNKDNASNHITNALLLMRSWLLYVPNSSQLAVEILLPFVKSRITTVGLAQFGDIAELLREAEELLEQCHKKEQKQYDPETPFNLHEEEPPDDFRALSVFPTKKDIYDHDPFVRVNLTSSAYRNPDHYLDVQFRLLREDFIRPLRQGINDFFSSNYQPGKKKQRLEGVKIYQNVSIEFPKLSPKGITYCLHFDIDRLKFVQWQNSKRLMYGNLVCLSADDFAENFLFASITNRSVELLRDGYIEVEFWNIEGTAVDIDNLDDQEERHDENSSCLITPADMKKTYAMAESEAYFEAYRHVLAGLQETRAIPLRQYIVDCFQQVDSPRYLRGLGRTATYDFSCILKNTGTPTGNNIYDVLNTYRWPDAETLGLDHSQVAALQSALTRELSIIQGPPGTGKTFVGLMIMKILLANRNSNSDRNNPRRVITTEKTVPDGPILVVCYTNHALDQFLEGIARFHPKGLIRVGGRGKVKELEQYNLANVRRGTAVTTDKFMRKTFYNLRCDLEAQVSAVEESQNILKASTDSILGLEVLMPVIDSHHTEQLEGLAHSFKSGRSNGFDKALLQWLGVSKKEYQVSDMMSFVIEETLKVVVQHYAPYQISRSRVLQAIACTGELEADKLLPCILEHENHDEVEPLINSDIVCTYLDNYPVQVNMDMFLHMGFNPLEVKCACFVLSSKPQLGKQLNEGTLIEWIKQKREMETEDVNFEEEEIGANVEEEANYVEDQRMIDGGDGDLFMQIDRGRGRRQQHQTNKNVAAARHDDLHFEADFSGDLDDGFQYQRGQVKRMQKDLQRRLKKEMTKQDVLSDGEVRTIGNIFRISSDKKWKLYRYWVRKLLAIHRKNISKRSVEYNRLTKALTDIRNSEAFEILKTADVIAMTTTGAAKYRDMIYKLPIQIMIVEEAAEVLEAHIVTSMPETTEHLILIGDHQQLKPSPTVYDLATKYNLDMSLFERLVNNGISCSRLELQHRMRPKIADLIRPHIYKVLRDHESVMTYDDVMGVKSNIFFLSHDHLEDNVKDSKSKVNQHEADFMIGLCGYLLQQGYLPEQITILAAYVGQLFAFKKAIGRKLPKGIRITAVDNFQGEENDIILLSLVRSNEQGKIGFLSIENRVCVALSRAKKGLYCIGNFQLIKHKSELWRKILTGLEREDLTGDSMPLQCKNHPETITKVKCQEDFEKVPEGGCGKPCSFRLDCGHVCPKLCHPDDTEHKGFVCNKKVKKTCPNGHETPQKCSQKLQCKVLIEKVMPICNHSIDVPCSKDPVMVTCTKPCEKKLLCRHKCSNPCGVRCAQTCHEPVELDASCGHKVKVPCSRQNTFDIQNCTAKCNELLKCEHVCKGTCGECKQGRLHVGCNHPRCGRVLCCGHICQEKCTAVCPPCFSECETSCRHSRCPKPCCEPCVLCKEKCDWKCAHFQCTNLCSEPCDRPPCNERCKKRLKKCGHPCIGLCGEPCPKLCRICDKEKVEEIFFGDEDEEDAKFVQLECGHIFTYKGLDTWMNQENVDESEKTDIKLKECPRCKTPIRKSKRYGNLVNKTLIAINQVRIKIAGSPEEVNQNRRILLDAIMDDNYVKSHYMLQFNKLITSVKAAKTNPALSVIELQFDCLSEFATIKEKLSEIRSSKLTPIENALMIRMKQMEDWILRSRHYFSEQEKEDLTQERQRCKDCLKLIQTKHELSQMQSAITVDGSKMPKIQMNVGKINKYVVDDLSPYQPAKQAKIKRAFDRLDALVPNLLPGLGITDDERKMILAAIDLSPGHWFKCPNGHVYCIGECGGAMEKAKCPECDADIGGTSHTLDPTNMLASEMDGATRAIWDPNNFAIPPEVRRWRDGL